MAWFKKSLEDLKKAIDKEDWDTARKIMNQHNRNLDREEPRIEHELSSIRSRLTSYGDDLDNAAGFLDAI